jgi:uncharacterized protein (DUF1697 family)
VTVYVALLRAVNVSGTGALPMQSLRAMGEECGFDRVRTFIASGNLLFNSEKCEAVVCDAISAKIATFFGRSVPVFVRSAADMQRAVEGNPFGDDKPSRVMAYFLGENPDQQMIDEARDAAGERLALGHRLIYVSYGNMNSVAKIADLLKAMA